MSLKKITLVVAACDSCGSGWWENATDTQPRFEDQATARRILVKEYGWRIDKRTSGRHRMFCSRCQARTDCELYGCDWPQDDFAAAGTVRLKACHRCNRVHRDDSPPNDMVSSDLPSWLADLDRRIWPVALTENPVNDYTYLGDEA